SNCITKPLSGSAQPLAYPARTTAPTRRSATSPAARAALGADSVAAAFGKGWELDHRTAVTEADPARLSRDQRTR
ncbi:hypothetical protein ACFV7Q_38755, partial [Streptomyces sp. NPDC059851]|uniref:hypothetical protein n=1 Tax=Streptomyces sp. NPDC059851 TaxID=3346971 RepID=UPI0036539A0D